MGNTSTKHSSSSPPGSPSSPTQNNQHGHPSSSSSANASSPSSALFHSTTPHSSPFNTFTKSSLPSSPSSRNNANSSTGGGPTTPPKPPFLPPETLVDGGALFPLSNIYPNQPHDWDRWTTDRLISERRLAPFYRGLGEWDDDLEAKSDDGDEEEEGDGDGEEGVDREAETAVISGSEDEEDDGVEGRQVGDGVEGKKGIDKGKAKVDLSSSVATITPTRAWEGKKTVVEELRKVRENNGIKIGGLEDLDKEAELYRHATECPICFLYYPSNLNTSRCCFQPICTECVVHIKRAEPTTTNLTSEPACCPYCVEDNFGVIYRPPPFGKRSGAGADKVLFGGGNGDVGEEEGGATPNGRKKSVSHTSSQVVTVDQIHPDWEAKLEAVKAAAARRANRRIIFRQVGDRLIPVGISSGRSAMALAAAAAAAANSGNGSGSGEGGGSGSDGSGSVGRRGRRHQDNGAIDLEELMIMEAMRLSLIEQQDREKKEKEQKEKEEKAKSERERKEKEIQKRTTREQQRRSHLSPTTTSSSSMSPRPLTGDSSISSSSSSSSRTGSPMPMLGQPSTTSLSSQAPLLSSKFNNASTATFSTAGGGGGGLNGFSTRSVNAGASEDDDSATTPGDEQEEPSYVPLGDGDDEDEDGDDEEGAADKSDKGKGKETFGGDDGRDGEEDGGVGPRTPPLDGGFSRFGRENGSGNGNRMYGGFKGKGRSDAFVVPERRSSVAD